MERPINEPPNGCPSLPKSVERLLDREGIKLLLGDITLVGNYIGHDEPNSRRSKSADFNPRSHRVLNILMKFSQRPHLDLLRTAVLAPLNPELRRSNCSAEIESRISALQSHRLGAHPDLDSETVVLAFLLDDARHLHLQIDQTSAHQKLCTAIANAKNSRFPENSKLFTFVRAALDRYERNS